ncbi:MAG TPA: hypothetical protein VJ398_06355 [Acidimicrobiia bacterium]|nr:hypothetical protein [Acidimicrobiia bacterium]
MEILKTVMNSAEDQFVGDPTVDYLQTDIDCFLCLEDVRQALMSLPEVETVEEDSSVGCLVVTHRSQPGLLRRVVTAFGHRFVKADNGEVGMGEAAASTHTACRHTRRPASQGKKG